MVCGKFLTAGQTLCRRVETMLQIFKKLKSQSGQTATEYMLIIAVVVLGAVAGASILLPQFRSAVTSLASQVASTITGSASTSGSSITGNVN